MKVANIKAKLATKFSSDKGIDLVSRKLRIIAATAINESATVGNSYPTAIVFKARVGLKVRRSAVRKANFRSRVLVISSTKNAHAKAYRRLCRKASAPKKAPLNAISSGHISSGYPAGQ
jgi:hypothetical protein